ncbi:hypothetical protein M8C21_032890, partial [Ambrosia artemisiifolia]
PVAYLKLRRKGSACSIVQTFTISTHGEIKHGSKFLTLLFQIGNFIRPLNLTLRVIECSIEESSTSMNMFTFSY